MTAESSPQTIDYCPLTMRRSILLVEDEAFLAELMAFHLRREGFAVLHVSSGLEAFAVLQSVSIDLIIADSGLPSGEGLSLLRHIEAEHPYLFPRMLIISAHLQEETRRYFAQRAIPVLMKPFELDDLMTWIRALLEPSTPPCSAA